MKRPRVRSKSGQEVTLPSVVGAGTYVAAALPEDFLEAKAALPRQPPAGDPPCLVSTPCAGPHSASTTFLTASP